MSTGTALAENYNNVGKPRPTRKKMWSRRGSCVCVGCCVPVSASRWKHAPICPSMVGNKADALRCELLVARLQSTDNHSWLTYFSDFVRRNPSNGTLKHTTHFVDARNPLPALYVVYLCCFGCNSNPLSAS